MKLINRFLFLFPIEMKIASGVEYIQLLSEMRQLNLSECTKLSDAALFYLALMTKMETLNLSKCVQITDSGVIYLSRQQRLRVRIYIYIHIRVINISFSEFETKK
jgi:hypothetical protein